MRVWSRSRRRARATPGVSPSLVLLLSPLALLLFLFAALARDVPSAPATRAPAAVADLDALAACLSANRSLLVRRADRDFSAFVNRSFRTDAAVALAFAQPASERDVQTVVRCARSVGVRVCARSGGHSFSGSSLCDGLVVDLSRLATTSFAAPANAGVEAGSYDLEVGPAATLGDLLTYVHRERGRWFGAGICPGVGVAGFVLGGGHGPYDGLLGLGCDALRGYRMVDRDGRVVVASRDENPDLFWAGCGAGAGHFGIVTQLTLHTAPATPFDNATAFQLAWPIERAGEVIEAMTNEPFSAAKVWVRVEIVSWSMAQSRVLVYGACFDMAARAADGSDCLARLSKLRFFAVPDKRVDKTLRARDARALHNFLLNVLYGGDDGSPQAVDRALTRQRYASGGYGDRYMSHSVFVRMGTATRRQQRRFWQRFAETCRLTNATRARGVHGRACQVNPFDVRAPARRDEERLAAFAYRDEDFLTFSYMSGGDRASRAEVYDGLRDATRPFASGVYVNYPQRELGKTEYPRLYWGDRLSRLQRLKRTWDPDSFFLQQQPIGVGRR